MSSTAKMPVPDPASPNPGGPAIYPLHPVSYSQSSKLLEADPQNIAREKLYLDLLKKCLTRLVFPERYRALSPDGTVGAYDIRWKLYPILKSLLANRNLEIIRRVDFNSQTRIEGSYLSAWPPEAETMIGVKRLDDIEHCITDVIARGVPSDILEAGVWRGGAAIFMRAVLGAYRDAKRIVWLADSFQGLPSP